MRSSDILNPLVRRELLEEREYQLRIAEGAIDRNTLVVLPTALGKTIIAALVASYYLYYYSDRKILVLAPTRPLVEQHRDTFLRILKIRPDDVRVLTGRDDPGYRLYLWDGNFRVYFATPQVVSNDLENGLKLEDFSLIIFDECHRAVGNYAYVKVAREYIRSCGYPVILGLTASPGADINRIREVVRNLYIEHIEARTEEDPDVKPYISSLDVEWIYVEPPKPYFTAYNILRDMLMDRLERLRGEGLIKKDPKYVFRGDLVRLGDELRYKLELTSLEEERGRIYRLIMLQSTALSLFHAIELLMSQGRYTLIKFLERLEEDSSITHRMITGDPRYKTLRNIVFNLPEHPKMDRLIQAIAKAMMNNSSKIIVFTQYRDTAKYIADRLRDLGFKAVRFIGQARKAGDEGMKQRDQVEVINRFREGEFNILVATSIAEEGLDIPAVDQVIFYEPVPSEIRFIQRRGRTGRGRYGRVVILASKDTVDTAYLRATSKKVRRMINIIRKMGGTLRVKVARGFKPPINIMPDEVIREAEEYRVEELPSETEELEIIYMKEYNREIRYVARELLNTILERGGCDLNELISMYEGEFPPSMVRNAVAKLIDEDQVVKHGGMIYPRGMARGRFRERDIHTIEIEKIYRGSAVVIVDDKWRAVLWMEDYNGPRQFMKRGMRFKAVSKLYRYGGKLHIRIRDVIRIEY